MECKARHFLFKPKSARAKEKTQKRLGKGKWGKPWPKDVKEEK